MSISPKKSVTSFPVFERSAPPAGPRTIVVFGTPRGGTSMIAGAVMGLGVPMGTALANNLEDPEFNMDLSDQPYAAFLEGMRGAIKTRNAAHSVWGFKYPRAEHYLHDLASDLRAPMFVCVYRDPVPATIRSKSKAGAALPFMVRRLRNQVRNTLLLEQLEQPSLMVSYEKAAAYPLEFLRELSAFAGLPLPENIDPILDFMRPGEYKDPGVFLQQLSTPKDPST